MSDNITLPREVVKLALDAFEAVMPFSTTQRELKIRAVEALRTALAAPAQKPDALALAERLASGRLAIIEQLTDEVETLRREAERYRWLRDKAYVWDSDMPKAMQPVALWLHDVGNADIDAIINAAKENKR